MESTTRHPGNPLVTPWLKAAQGLAEPWGNLWTGVLARRQIELMAEFNRQALRAWAGAWSFAPAAEGPPAGGDTMSSAGTAPALAASQAQVAEATALPSAPATDVAPAVPPAVTPATPAAPAAARRTKPAAPLRTAAPRRKAGPIGVGPRRGGPGKPKGATRH